MTFQFLAPVYIGETICARVTVMEKDPQKKQIDPEDDLYQ